MCVYVYVCVCVCVCVCKNFTDMTTIFELEALSIMLIVYKEASILNKIMTIMYFSHLFKLNKVKSNVKQSFRKDSNKYNSINTYIQLNASLCSNQVTSKKTTVRRLQSIRQ